MPDSVGDAERANRAKVIDDKKKRAQRMADDAQTDFQQEMQQIFNNTAGKVGDVLIDYAQKQGYTLVLDGGEMQQGPFVLYSLPSTDISKAIVDAYNVKSGVAAPASLRAALEWVNVATSADAPLPIEDVATPPQPVMFVSSRRIRG